MARARTVDEIDAQIEKLKERERQLRAQKQALKQRENAAARKRRNHALMVYGAMVQQHLGRGDWTRLDPQAVSAYLARFGRSAPARECAGDPLDGGRGRRGRAGLERAGREAEEGRCCGREEGAREVTALDRERAVRCIAARSLHFRRLGRIEPPPCGQRGARPARGGRPPRPRGPPASAARPGSRGHRPARRAAPPRPSRGPRTRRRWPASASANRRGSRPAAPTRANMAMTSTYLQSGSATPAARKNSRSNQTL